MGIGEQLLVDVVRKINLNLVEWMSRTDQQRVALVCTPWIVL